MSRQLPRLSSNQYVLYPSSMLGPPPTQMQCIHFYICSYVCLGPPPPILKVVCLSSRQSSLKSGAVQQSGGLLVSAFRRHSGPIKSFAVFCIEEGKEGFVCYRSCRAPPWNVGIYMVYCVRSHLLMHSPHTLCQRL